MEADLLQMDDIISSMETDLMNANATVETLNSTIADYTNEITARDEKINALEMQIGTAEAQLEATSQELYSGKFTNNKQTNNNNIWNIFLLFNLWLVHQSVKNFEIELAKQKELFDQMEVNSQQTIQQKSEESQQQIKFFEMELAKQKELFDQMEVNSQQKAEASLQQINSLADEIIDLKSKLKETENLLSFQVTD